MNSGAIFWLALAIVLGIIEMSTVNMVTIWFAISALITSVLAAMNIGSFSQSVIFIVLSGVLVVLTRPFVKKIMSKRTVATNADRIVGAKGVVINDIEPVENKGQIKVMGQIWSAKTADGSSLEKDKAVVVTAIEGVRVVVKEVRDSEIE